MKILIISDSHNNQKLLRKQMTLDVNYEVVFHLGDYFGDLDENYDLIENKKYYHVPGIITLDYLSRNKFPWIKFELEGWKFLLVHDRNNVPNDLEDVNIVCFGHTHKPELYKEQNTIFINPGHSKKTYDRGFTASHIMLDLSPKEAIVEFLTYEGDVFNRINVTK